MEEHEIRRELEGQCAETLLLYEAPVKNEERAAAGAERAEQKEGGGGEKEKVATEKKRKQEEDKKKKAVSGLDRAAESFFVVSKT